MLHRRWNQEPLIKFQTFITCIFMDSGLYLGTCRLFIFIIAFLHNKVIFRTEMCVLRLCVCFMCGLHLAHTPSLSPSSYQKAQIHVCTPEGCLSDTSSMFNVLKKKKKNVKVWQQKGPRQRALINATTEESLSCRHKTHHPRGNTPQACRTATESLQQLLQMDMCSGILGGKFYGVENCPYW